LSDLLLIAGKLNWLSDIRLCPVVEMMMKVLVPLMEEFCDQINEVSAITLCAALYF